MHTTSPTSLRRGVRLVLASFRRIGRRRERLLLPGILAAAFLLRVWWSLAADVDPAGVFHDYTWFDHVAKQLADGRGFAGFDGEPTAFWPPGYPAVLSVVYLVFGHSLIAAWLLNALLGALTCLFVYWIGCHVFDRRIGLAGAAVLAIFPGHIFYTALTMTEVLYAAFFTFIVYLFLRWRSRLTLRDLPRWCLFGLLLGAASLIRGEALFFVSVPIAAWLVTSIAPRHVVVQGSAILIGLIIALAPWTLRNELQLGYPTVVSTGGSEVFWGAHWEGARGTWTPLDVIETRWRDRYNHLPNPEREVELSKAQMREGLEYLVSHPLEEVKLLPKKLYYLYHVDDGALDLARRDGAIFNPFRDQVLATLANAYYFGVIALALAGLRRSVSQGGTGAVFLILVVLYCSVLYGFVFFGDSRYHFALLPIFSVMAATGLVHLWSGIGMPAWMSARGDDGQGEEGAGRDD